MQYFSTFFMLFGSASSNSITSSKLCSYLQQDYTAYASTTSAHTNTQSLTATVYVYLSPKISTLMYTD